MKRTWTIRNVYLYAVCLITLVIAIFATVNLIRGVVTLAYPEPVNVIVDADPARGMTEADIAQQQAWTRRYAVIDLVGNVALLAIAVPLYIGHWRMIGEHPDA